jgi:acetolactate synthase-1/2/3 large subunit
MTGARFIAETLRGYGVTHLFYVEAILRRTLVEMEALGIERIVAHAEKAAAYMADGYARVSGRPGVCFAQSVGAANLAAGLQDPYLGVSPVIAITGRKAPLLQHRNAYQEILHGPMFDPVTKYNVDASTLEQLPFYLRQAFREATTGAPAPVHIDLIGNLGEEIETAEAEIEVTVDETYTHYPALRLTPDDGDVERVVQALSASERPVIIAGGGARISSAGPEIVSLAELLSIPVATSMNGKGTIPETHHLSVGVVGTYSRACANQVVSEADLVVFIGSHTGDQVTNQWRVPALGTPVIQIDIDPSELGRNYPNTLGLLGDAKATVGQLIAHSAPRQGNPAWLRRTGQLVRDWQAQYEPVRHSDATPIRPERLCNELTAALPADAILVSDTGYSAIWTGTMVEMTQPTQTFIRAAGSLGWSFPASLGAKCAWPERPVICFTGDGGFWCHIGELETACRWGINTVTIVNNNSGYGQCVPGINRAYDGRPGKREEMYQFCDVNFANLAQEMGGLGIRVEHPGKIKDALHQALAANKPTVVEVITDINAEAPTPWMPQ